MQTKQDYYQILGIAPSASMEDIHEAYRKLAFQFHPDRNQMIPIANQKMLEINDAYSTLSDSIRRSAYDIPMGYHNAEPKFKRGSRVRVSAHASPFNDHIGVVDQEPIQGSFRFWYIVKILVNGLPSIPRLAEEQLKKVDQMIPAANQKMPEINETYSTLSGPIERRSNDIPVEDHAPEPKFKRGNKVRVSSHASPFYDHIGVVDQEPFQEKLRFWYIVKLTSNGLESNARFAEEQLG
jgi:DnaJ-class molecular chaperone